MGILDSQLDRLNENLDIAVSAAEALRKRADEAARFIAHLEETLAERDREIRLLREVADWAEDAYQHYDPRQPAHPEWNPAMLELGKAVKKIHAYWEEQALPRRRKIPG